MLLLDQQVPLLDQQRAEAGGSWVLTNRNQSAVDDAAFADRHSDASR
jgi:alkylhydroperoxidase family enzyme